MTSEAVYLVVISVQGFIIGVLVGMILYPLRKRGQGKRGKDD